MIRWDRLLLISTMCLVPALRAGKEKKGKRHTVVRIGEYALGAGHSRGDVRINQSSCRYCGSLCDAQGKCTLPRSQCVQREHDMTPKNF